MLFTVIVLVGTGWSLMKPFLSDRDKKILFVVLPLQVSMRTSMRQTVRSIDCALQWSSHPEKG